MYSNEQEEAQKQCEYERRKEDKANIQALHTLYRDHIKIGRDVLYLVGLRTYIHYLNDVIADHYKHDSRTKELIGFDTNKIAHRNTVFRFASIDSDFNGYRGWIHISAGAFRHMKPYMYGRVKDHVNHINRKHIPYEKNNQYP